MTTYVWRDGELIEKHLAPPLNESFGEAPFIISDNMDSTRHMATGRYHTSKATFRADTKASGCVEVGTDTSILKPRKQITLDRRQRRDDIKKSIYQLKNGVANA